MLYHDHSYVHCRLILFSLGHLQASCKSVSMPSIVLCTLRSASSVMILFVIVLLPTVRLL